MADTPQDLLTDPEFQKLSPEAQHIVIGKKFPEYAKLSPEAQKIVLSSSKVQPVPSGTTPENMVAVEEANKINSPYPMVSPNALPGVDPNLVKNITGSRALTPEEQAKENEVFKQGMPMLAANVATEGAASLPLLARLGITGGAAGLTSAVTGGSTSDVASNTALGAGGELGGGALKYAGEKLSPMASQALARILRLSPKAYQFGREPAEEVLREGLASGNLAKMVDKIGEASKQTTSQLNTALKNTPGSVNVEDLALNVANTLPGSAGSRFLKVVDDAAAKLGYRANQMTSLTPAETNALKQEIARQARFVEGDMRATVSNGAKVFGGKTKDALINLNPDIEDLLQTSANLTEASKAGDFAVRSEQAGQGKRALSAIDIKKPVTYPRLLTDTVTGTKLLFKAAEALKDSGIPISQALRTAFGIVYPNASE